MIQTRSYEHTNKYSQLGLRYYRVVLSTHMFQGGKAQRAGEPGPAGGLLAPPALRRGILLLLSLLVIIIRISINYYF